MAIYSLPVIIPVASADLRVSPEKIGFYISAIYATSTVTGLFSGQLVSRFGAPMMFRLMLLLTAFSVLVLLFSSPLALIAMAALVGVASGPLNPTGSQVLAQVTPESLRALVFSLKQCATPFGGVLAGIILPPVMLTGNWQLAMLIIVVASVLLAIVIVLPDPSKQTTTTQQPLTKIPAPKSGRNSFSVRKTGVSIMRVWQQRDLRSLTIAAVGLAAAQMALATYLVVYLWREVGFSEAAAGLVFAGLHLSGISTRIVFGFIADRLASAKTILICLCFVLAVALVLVSLFSPVWPLLFVYIVVFIAGGSGNGWVGLYYAEIARLTPVEQVAEITGASQFFTYIGLLAGPILFAAMLALTDSFRVTLIVFAVMILLAGLSLAGLLRVAVVR